MTAPFDPFAKVDLSVQTQAPDTGQFDPFAGLAGGEAFDPFTRADNALRPFEMQVQRGIEAASSVEIPWERRHPILNALIVEPAKDVASALRASFIGLARAGPVNAGFGAAMYLSSQPREEQDRAMRGSGLILSFIPGMVATRVGAPLALRFIGRGRTAVRAASFLAGEALGGALYGGAAPLEEGKTRREQILEQSAIFAAASGVFAGAAVGVATAFRRYIRALPRAKRIKIIRSYRTRIAQAEEQLAEAGTSLSSLDVSQQARIAQDAYKGAIEEVDPGLLKDFDEKLQNLAQLEEEPTPRFFDEPQRIDVTAPPGERELDLPELPFRQALEQTEPGFRYVTRKGKLVREPIPPEVEPAVAPKGFVPGAGEPTRIAPEEQVFYSGQRETGDFAGTDIIFTTQDAEVAQAYGLVRGGIGTKAFVPKEDARILFANRPFELGHVVSDAEWLAFKKALQKRTGWPDSQIEGIRRSTTEPLTWEAILDFNEPQRSRDFRVLQAIRDIGYDAIHTFDDATRVEGDLLERGAPRTVIHEGQEPVPITIITNPDKFRALTPEETAAISDPRSIEQALDDIFQFEPRLVVPGEPPVAGYVPTAAGDEILGMEPVVRELSLADAIAEDAVARIDPLHVAAPEVRRESELMLQIIGDPGESAMRSTKAIEEAMTKALQREGPAAHEGLLLDLSYPQPWEVDLGRKVTKREAEAVRKGIAEAMRREGVPHPDIAPITLEASEQIKAPWAYGPGKSSVPDLDALSTVAQLPDKHLDELGKAFAKLASESGAVPARVLTGITGAGAEFWALNTEDPGTRRVLATVGGLLLLSSMHSVLGNVLNKHAKSLIMNFNPAKFMSKGTKDMFDSWVGAVLAAKTEAVIMQRQLEKIIPKNLYRAAMFVIEETDPARGFYPAEWALFNQQQQRALLMLSQYNLRLGQLLEHVGVLKQGYVERYVTHKLPPDSFQRWKVTGYRILKTGGGFTERRHIQSLRELEAWAAKEGVAGPVYDLPRVQSAHMAEAHRAISVARLIKELESKTLLIDMPKLQNQVPADWRQLRILGWGNKVAPEPVAKALENISSPQASDFEVLNALDKVKGMWMRSIMFWFWEHGVNALRAWVLTGFNPTHGLGTAISAVKRLDPALVEAARYGLDIFHRPDYVYRTSRAFDKLSQTANKITGIGSIWRGGVAMMEKQDRMLWENIIPAMQYAIYQNKMMKWAKRTSHKFLPGSPEYVTAARESAHYANTVMGKMPTELANPSLLRWLRLVMFSPQWTTSRIALTVNAAGEASEILAGRLNPAHASFLGMKMRQVAMLGALTWLGSKFMSGEEPQFNPNTNKFYMKTGLKSDTGRDVGLDLTGWWQDDLKLFGAPMDYAAARLSPILREGFNQVTGRDYLGRDMTSMQRIESIFRSTGVPAEAAELAIRVGQGIVPGGAPGPGGGELLQRGTGVAAIANVSALPRPMDAMLAKMSKRLLKQVGIPQNEYAIFELSRLLRGNVISGREIIDQRVITYLAYRRRTFATKEPLGYLWEHGRRVMFDF